MKRASCSLASVAYCLCLVLAAGCGGSSEPKPKKVITIDANSAPPPDQGAPVAAPPPPVVAANPRAETASQNADKRKKGRDRAPTKREIEPGEEIFALLSPAAPWGLPFEIDGHNAEANVDRFAYVPNVTGVDSTQFAVSSADASKANAAADEGAAVKDVSTTPYEVPDGFTAVESAGRSASGLPWRIRGDEDGAVMALVPEGVFIQGSNTGPANTRPEHGVLLDAFYIDLREVTYARYDKYRETVSDARKVSRAARAANDPQEPVLGLSWAEAHAFAVWAGKDLPTEAQWEKAARGPDGFQFPWGNGRFIWHRPRASGQIDPVASFKGDVSPYGLFDMAGNAREWCSDWYVEKYYSQLSAESGSTARNPTGPKAKSGTNQRVVKGGDPDWHVWARAGINQSERPQDVGFRCVLKLKREGASEKRAKKSSK